MAYDWTSSTIFDGTYDITEGQSLYAIDSNNLFIVFNDWTTYGLCFSKSSNGGTTWSTPVTIDANYGYIYTDRAIWVSSNGQTIYITYVADWDGDIQFAKSTDGGSSFSANSIDTTNFADAQYHSMSVYGTDGQYIYVAYTCLTAIGFNDDAIRLTYSENYGSTWTTKFVRNTIVGPNNDIQVVALNANTIYIVAGSVPSLPGSDWGLSFSKTTDKGDNWTHTVVDDINTYGVGWDQSMYVKDLNTIYISYSKPQMAPTILYLAKSTDGGSSFAISTIDDAYTPGVEGGFWFSSIGSPDNGSTIIISYYHQTLSELKVAYSTDSTNWTKEIVDTTNYCGEWTSLVCLTNYIFIIHDTEGGGVCGHCMRLTKAAISSLPISSILMYKFRPVVLK